MRAARRSNGGHRAENHGGEDRQPDPEQESQVRDPLAGEADRIRRVRADRPLAGGCDHLHVPDPELKNPSSGWPSAADRLRQVTVYTPMTARGASGPGCAGPPDRARRSVRRGPSPWHRRGRPTRSAPRAARCRSAAPRSARWRAPRRGPGSWRPAAHGPPPRPRGRGARRAQGRSRPRSTPVVHARRCAANARPSATSAISSPAPPTTSPMVAVPAAPAPCCASRATSPAAGYRIGNWPAAWFCTSPKPSGDEVNVSSMAVSLIVP